MRSTSGFRRCCAEPAGAHRVAFDRGGARMSGEPGWDAQPWTSVSSWAHSCVRSNTGCPARSHRLSGRGRYIATAKFAHCARLSLPLETEYQHKILHFHRLRNRIQLQITATGPVHSQEPRHVRAVGRDLNAGRGHVALSKMQSAPLT